MVEGVCLLAGMTGRQSLLRERELSTSTKNLKHFREPLSNLSTNPVEHVGSAHQCSPLLLDGA